MPECSIGPLPSSTASTLWSATAAPCWCVQEFTLSTVALLGRHPSGLTAQRLGCVLASRPMMSRCNDNVCKYNNIYIIIQHLQSSSRARGTQLQLLMNLVIHESCDNMEVYCKSNSHSISRTTVPSESDATSTKVALRGSYHPEVRVAGVNNRLHPINQRH